MTVPLTKQLLQEKGWRPKKSFGQNFLVDEIFLDEIIVAAQISPEEIVLEIGPGTGNLTGRLLSLAQRVVAVELDQKMVALLKEKFKKNTNFYLIEGDFLSINLKRILPEKRPIKVVANIPYYITSPIVMRLLDPSFLRTFQIKTILLMVQKEVAERLSAKPGGKAYGIFSIAVQLRSQVEEVIKVPRIAFYPVPKVDSAVIKITPLVTPLVRVLDEKFFFRLVKGAFSQRRRTLRNALLGAQFPLELLDEAFQSLGINPMRRGETLSIEEFAHLADYLFQKGVK